MPNGVPLLLQAGRRGSARLPLAPESECRRASDFKETRKSHLSPKAFVETQSRQERRTAPDASERLCVGELRSKSDAA
jgi:hypothetical protein